MKKRLVLLAALALAACNKQPAPPRIPDVTLDMIRANPKLVGQVHQQCTAINASGTLTKLEDTRCVKFETNAKIYGGELVRKQRGFAL